MEPIMVRTSVHNAAVIEVGLAPDSRVNVAIRTLYLIPGVPSYMSLDLPPEDIDGLVADLLARKAEALAIRTHNTASKESL